jgi:hypothetical protein
MNFDVVSNMSWMTNTFFFDLDCPWLVKPVQFFLFVMESLDIYCFA